MANLRSKTTTNFGTFAAQQFKESFGELKEDNVTFKNNVYLFLAKTTPWNTTNSSDNVSDIENVANVETHDYQVQLWKDMIGAKRIISSNTALVIEKNLWDTNGDTIYKEYQHDDINLYLHPTATESQAADAGGYIAGDFFVMNSTFDVYKCLQTGVDNNGNQIKSTVQPTIKSATPFRTADSGAATFGASVIGGYKWQYMYTISSGDQNKFVDSQLSQWIPVKQVDADLPGAYGSQLNVQNRAVDGSIQVVKVTNPTVNGPYQRGLTPANASNKILRVEDGYGVSGDGSGLIVDFYLNNDANIYFAEVVDAGSGYTTVTLTPTSGRFLDSDLVVEDISTYPASLATGGTAATFKPIYSPSGGHGSNAPVELGARNVMLLQEIEVDDSAITSGNDFRKFGLVFDPKLVDSQTLATGTIYRQTYQITLKNINGNTENYFAPDDPVQILSDTTKTATVVDYTQTDDSTGVVTLNQKAGDEFVAGEILQHRTKASTVATINTINKPQLEPNSGTIMYVEHRVPVERSVNQKEEFKIIFEF